MAFATSLATRAALSLRLFFVRTGNLLSENPRFRVRMMLARVSKRDLAPDACTLYRLSRQRPDAFSTSAMPRALATLPSAGHDAGVFVAVCKRKIFCNRFSPSKGPWPNDVLIALRMRYRPARQCRACIWHARPHVSRRIEADNRYRDRDKPLLTPSCICKSYTSVRVNILNCRLWLYVILGCDNYR